MNEIDLNILEQMIKQAKDISEKAYCPYSNFPVGAVVLTEDGNMYQGCNVENASYGLTCCAERNAIFNMVAQGRRKISAVVIYTPTQSPSAPCGACRQVINEFGPSAIITSVCDSTEVLSMGISDLLPASFGAINLI